MGENIKLTYLVPGLARVQALPIACCFSWDFRTGDLFSTEPNTVPFGICPFEKKKKLLKTLHYCS
jgi:hypothetical protein